MPAQRPSLRVIPLGGLGEVGMNCLALDDSEQVLVIDCGTSFPNDDYGISVHHPRFDWLYANRKRVAAIVLTHGHEDHIGALPYLLQGCPDLRVPIVGPRHALRLVARRLIDHGLEEQTSLLSELPLGQTRSVGAFQLQNLRVSHSIADATALLVTTVAGRVLHTGDFNFDPEPSDGEATDEEALLRMGDEGVDLLLSDSTNVDNDSDPGSEAEVYEALDDVMRDSQQRVFVALFSSNIQRLISLGKIAARRGRRIVLLGRSLAQHVAVARELGYLKWSDALELPVERLRSYPRKEVLVLCSGTQAEAGSAMARLAEGSHRYARIDAGDRVIFSSRVIPGYERPVSELMDALTRLGAVVESRLSRPDLHTSGHANRREQRRMLELVRPRCFVPVHGTLHHLNRHAALARECGINHSAVIENGQVLVLQDGALRKGGDVPCGTVSVACSGQALDPVVLKTRRDLGRYGALSVALLCDKQWRLAAAPRLTGSGLPLFDEQQASGQLILALQAAWSSFRGRSTDCLEQEVHQFLRRHLEQTFGLRPLVAVHVLRSKAAAETLENE